VGQFVSTQMMSGCPPVRFLCAPEQPEWDVLSQLNAGPIFAPSGNVGAQWLPHPDWRVGATFQLPYWVDAPAELYVRLPATPMFERAYLEGNEADAEFELPWSLRLGVQWEPIEDLRIELAGAVEGWSIHDEIAIRPEKVAMRDVVGFPDPYYVPDVVIPRNFRETGSARLGAEYRFELFGAEWEPRLGASFESGAIPPENLSVVTVDMNKFTLGVGIGLHIDSFRVDIVYAHIFAETVEVDPDEAAVPIQTPMEANNPDPHTHNAGTYAAQANVLGAGLSYTWDVVPQLGEAPAPEDADEPAEDDEEPPADEDAAEAG
jgi:long-chain fatty acid transport protein